MYRQPSPAHGSSLRECLRTVCPTHIAGSHVHCARPIPSSKLTANGLDAIAALQSTSGRPLLPEQSASSRFSHIMLDVPKAATRTLLEAGAQSAVDPFARPRYMLDAPSQAPADPTASAAPATVPELTISTRPEQQVLPPTYSPQPTMPLPPPTYTSSPSPTPSPSAPSSPSPSPSPSTEYTEPAPTCTNSNGCLFTSASSGTVFDTFTLTTSGWQRARPAASASETLAYEFGVISPSPAGTTSPSYKARWLYSTLDTAVIVGLTPGQQTLYVCARAARVEKSSPSSPEEVTPIGDKACAMVTVAVSDQVGCPGAARQVPLSPYAAVLHTTCHRQNTHQQPRFLSVRCKCFPSCSATILKANVKVTYRHLHLPTTVHAHPCCSTGVPGAGQRPARRPHLLRHRLQHNQAHPVPDARNGSPPLRRLLSLQ